MGFSVGIGQLIATIGADIKPLQNALNNVDGLLKKTSKSIDFNMKNVGESLKKVGTSMSMFITLPLLAVAGASFKMASDLEESINKVNVAFKTSADVVLKWSKTTLDNFGIAQETALDMAATFGDMATSMGLSTSQAADMSKSLVGLAGDMASFKNIGIDIAQTGLVGIFSGETESLKKLGIVMTEVNLQEFALSQGIRKRIGDMSQVEKVQLRYNYIMKVTANSQGDFMRTQQGAANQMRIFTQGLKEISASFGQVLLPVITPVIHKLNEFLKSIVALSDTKKKWIVIIAGVVAAIGPLLYIVGTLITSIGAIISPVGLVIAGLAALTIGVITLGVKLRGSNAELITYSEYLDRLGGSSAKFSETLNKEISSLTSLFAALKSTNEGTATRSVLIDKINTEYSEYLPNLLTEKTTLDEIEAIESNLIALYKEKSAAKFKDQKVGAIVDAQLKREQDFLNQFVTQEAPLSSWVVALEDYQKSLGQMVLTNGKLSFTTSKEVQDLSTVTGRSVEFIQSLFEQLSGFRKEDKAAIEAAITLWQSYGGVVDDALNKSGTAVIAQLGILGSLKIKLDDLAKAKDEATTDEQIARINLETQAIEDQITMYEALGTTLTSMPNPRAPITPMPAGKGVEKPLIGPPAPVDMTFVESLTNEKSGIDAHIAQVGEMVRVYGKLEEQMVAVGSVYRDASGELKRAGSVMTNTAGVGLQALETSTTKQNLAFIKLRETTTATAEAIVDADQKVIASAEMMKQAELNVLGAMGQAATSWAGAWVDSMKIADDGLSKFLTSLISNVIQMMTAYYAQSIASATAGAGSSAAATGQAAVITFPVFLAEMLGAVIGAFASIPEFASGGLAYGPTVGMIGEYSGARSNPEVIAPLNKLKDMLGENNVQVYGEFVLRGETMIAAIDRVEKRRGFLK